MKTLMHCFILTLISGFVFSCEKEEITPNDPHRPQAHLSATLNELAYSAANDAQAYAYRQGEALIIHSEVPSDGGESISFTLPTAYCAAGSYQTTAKSPVYGLITTGEQIYSTQLPGSAGSITITYFDGIEILGHFRLTALAAQDTQDPLAASGSFRLKVRQ